MKDEGSLSRVRRAACTHRLADFRDICAQLRGKTLFCLAMSDIRPKRLFCWQPCALMRLSSVTRQVRSKAFDADCVYPDCAVEVRRGRPFGTFDAVEDASRQVKWIANFEIMAGVLARREVCRKWLAIAPSVAARWYCDFPAGLPRAVARQWFGSRGSIHVSAAARFGALAAERSRGEAAFCGGTAECGQTSAF